VRGRGGRAAAVGECSFIGFRYEVEEGGRRGVGRVLLDEGGIKEVRTMLRFLYRGAREGVPWRRAARRGGAGQAEGGSGDRGGRRPSGGPTWARGRRGLTSKGIFTGKIKLGCQGFWAELILGCAEK
jgi:hypothetical protein